MYIYMYYSLFRVLYTSLCLYKHVAEYKHITYLLCRCDLAVFITIYTNMLNERTALAAAGGGALDAGVFFTSIKS